MSGQQHAPAALYHRETPGTHFKGAGWAPGSVWMGGKSRPHRDSISDRPARSSVAIPTELPGPYCQQYNNNKKKVKCTPVQALRFCTGRTAHGGDRGIALLFLDHGTRRGEGSASRPGRSLPPGKPWYPLYRRLGGPQGRSGQVRKIWPHRDSIPGTSSP